MSEVQTASPLRTLKAEGSDLQSLLTKAFNPVNSHTQNAIEVAFQRLATRALEETPLIDLNAIATIDTIIARLDKQLEKQVNQIIHHPSYMKLESAWRGLHYLVSNTETDDLLKIRVMDVSKEELARSLAKFTGVAWDQSPLFKKVYEEEYGVLGGEPYGCLVGDYDFDHSQRDVAMLRDISKVAAAAHAPFITAASPSLMQMSSWQELSKPRDLSKIFSMPQYAPWRSLRESEDARYIGLTMPRFLARLPYGAKTNPVEEFSFEEEVTAGEHGHYAWANSAYAMAVNINRSFKDYGWASRIRGVESGGAVDELPTHTFPTDEGTVAMKCPTEIAISSRREAELAKNGLMPLLHRKHTDSAAFIGAQSLQKPREFDDPEATANAELSARLPYLFACCRFAHYLNRMVLDKCGTYKEAPDMQRWLTRWIMNYVSGDPANASEEVRARKPLADAEVRVEPVPGRPGYYTSKFYLRPHYQLEGLTVKLCLVSKVPTNTAA